jgi:hypothetical protein
MLSFEILSGGIVEAKLAGESFNNTLYFDLVDFCCEEPCSSTCVYRCKLSVQHVLS